MTSDDDRRCAQLNPSSLLRVKNTGRPGGRRLGVNRLMAGTIAVPKVGSECIATLVLETSARIDAPVSSTAPVDEDALELVRLALMLPAALVIPVPPGTAMGPAVLRVPGAALRGYRPAHVRDLTIVG